MTAKRFAGEFDKQYSGVYDDGEQLSNFEVVRLLNELYEENTMLKGHIKELYRLVKIDVDNGIEVYPKVLLEYIVNILKIIGDVE